MSGMWQEPVARVLASAGSGDAAVVVGTGTLVATPQYAVCLLTGKDDFTCFPTEASKRSTGRS